MFLREKFMNENLSARVKRTIFKRKYAREIIKVSALMEHAF